MSKMTFYFIFFFFGIKKIHENKKGFIFLSIYFDLGPSLLIFLRKLDSNEFKTAFRFKMEKKPWWQK